MEVPLKLRGIRKRERARPRHSVLGQLCKQAEIVPDFHSAIKRR
jgi:hypothetical protein